MMTRTGRNSRQVLRRLEATSGCSVLLFQSTTTISNGRLKRTASAVRALSARHMRCSSLGGSLRVTITNETNGSATDRCGDGGGEDDDASASLLLGREQPVNTTRDSERMRSGRCMLLMSKSCDCKPSLDRKSWAQLCYACSPHTRNLKIVCGVNCMLRVT